MNSEQPKQFNKVYMDTIILAVISVLLAMEFIMSFSINPNAAQVPKMITGAGLVLCVIEAISQVKKIVTGKYETLKSEGAGHQTLSWYMNLVLIAGYIAALSTIGFIPSSLVYLVLMPALMGYRKWKVVIPFAVITTVVLYLSFTYAFRVELPLGILLENFF